MINEKAIVRRFTVGGYPINGYLLIDRATLSSAFIDPGGYDDLIGAYIDNNKIQLHHIFFTHGHWDHTDGLDAFRKRYSAKRYAGVGEVRSANTALSGGEIINVGKLQVQALSTPGHTPGGISYYCADANCVFTGDALFCGSVGGTVSQQNAKQQLDAVAESIFTLPPTTLVMPAHGPMSTVQTEKYCNPFFG